MVPEVSFLYFVKTNKRQIQVNFFCEHKNIANTNEKIGFFQDCFEKLGGLSVRVSVSDFATVGSQM